MTYAGFASRPCRIALAAATAAVFAAGLACAAAPSAHAATTFSKTLLDSGTYYSSSKYDITGDKKADKLTIKSHAVDSEHHDKVRVYVNGKRKLTLKCYYDTDAVLFRIKSGRTFLYLKTYTDNGDAVSEGIYTYKSGKLKKVLNTYIWPNSNRKGGTAYHDNAYISHSGVSKIKVSGNTVKIKFYNMTSIAGTMNETFSFKYESGKLKRTSDTTTKVSSGYAESGTLTAATKISIYGKSDGSGTVSTVRKGTKVTLKALQLRPSDNFVSVKIATADGTTGWITYKSLAGKSDKSLHGSTLFKETIMAG